MMNARGLLCLCLLADLGAAGCGLENGPGTRNDDRTDALDDADQDPSDANEATNALPADVGAISPVQLGYQGASNIARPLHGCLVEQVSAAIGAEPADELSPYTPDGLGRPMEIEPVSTSREWRNEHAQNRAVFFFQHLRPDQAEPEFESDEGVYSLVRYLLLGVETLDEAGWVEHALEGTHLVSHYTTGKVADVGVVMLEELDGTIGYRYADLAPCADLFFEDIEEGGI